MALSTTDDHTDEMRVAAFLDVSHREATPWAPLLGPLVKLAELLPAYKNTQRGRAQAKQFKLIMFCVAVGVLFLEPSALTVSVACAFLVLAAVFPLGELRKRALQMAFSRARKRVSRRREPAELVLDHRRLELHIHNTMDRRVLTNRPFELRDLALDGRLPTVQVAPRAGARKRDTIWMALAQGDAGVEGLDEVARADTDAVAFTEDEGAFDALRHELAQRQRRAQRSTQGKA